MHAGDNEGNQVLKHIYQEQHSAIVAEVDPDPIMDVMLSKKVIDAEDFQRLRQVPDARDRCRDLLSLLMYASTHPQAFIHLRLALLSRYPWVVDSIDEKLPSLTSQLQQLHPDSSTDGTGLLRVCKSKETRKCRNCAALQLEVRPTRDQSFCALIIDYDLLCYSL